MNINNIENKAEKADSLLKALANKNRLIIMCSLCRGEKCVGELEEISGLSQSALSQHLAKLRQDGLVETRRQAQTIYYSTDCKPVHLVMGALADAFCDEDHEEIEDPST